MEDDSKMGIQLMHFPDELLLAVTSQIDNRADLRSIALTCHRFQRLAEPFIYRTIELCHGERVRHVAFAVTADPRRASMIDSLLISCPFDSWDGIEDLQPILPRMSRLNTLRIETPDCNQRQVHERMNWRRIQDRYESIFRQASLLNQGELCLQNLRSCVIHFVDHARSVYTIEQYASILLHPSLEHLTLSCVCLAPTICELLQGRSQTCSFKRLIFEQCDFDENAMAAILSLPKALVSLHLSENYRNPSPVGWMMPAAYTRVLQIQSRTLRHVNILLAHPSKTQYQDPFEKYDFSQFPKMTHLKFGQVPFYLHTNKLINHESFSRKSRINLDQIIFPPRLKHFIHSDFQSYSFDDNLQVLKNYFHTPPPASSSIQSLQPMAVSGQGNPQILDFILPIRSHNRVPEHLLHHLAQPSPYFHEIGIRYRVLDCEGPQGFIPPYLYGERSPLNHILIDSDRLNFVKPRSTEASHSSHANYPLSTTDDKDDEDHSNLYKQSILPSASRWSERFSRPRRPRVALDLAWIAENMNGVDWEQAVMEQAIPEQNVHHLVVPFDGPADTSDEDVPSDEDNDDENEDDNNSEYVDGSEEEDETEDEDD